MDVAISENYCHYVGSIGVRLNETIDKIESDTTVTNLPALFSTDAILAPFVGRPLRNPGTFNYVSGVDYQAQKGNQWCWAACAVMISQALGEWRTTAGELWTQCRVVKLVYPAFTDKLCKPALPANWLVGICGRFNCADEGARNTDGVVSDALRMMLPAAKVPLVGISQPNVLSNAQVQEMIDRGQPIAVLNHIDDHNSKPRRHYVLIVGYDAPRGEHLIWDPATGIGLRRIDRQRWYEDVGMWIGSVPLLAR